MYLMTGLMEFHRGSADDYHNNHLMILLGKFIC